MAIARPKALKPPQREALTVDDWYRLPDTAERYELYDGMLVMAPPPDWIHQSIASIIHFALLEYALAHGGWVVESPVGVVLAPTLAFQPDVVYLSRSRMGLGRGRGIEGAPDLVVEVASPSTRRYDLHTKLPAYFEHGVLEVWIVDPVGKTVSVYSPAEPNAPAVVKFGEDIPSAVVSVGTAYLERLPTIED
jgi:Uma2 family endonuclease